MTASAASRCSAVPVADLMVCDRCGLEWLAGGERPPCAPISFPVLRDHMMAELNSAECWLGLLAAEKAACGAVDPAKQRRRVALTAAVLRLIERVMADRSIMEKLTAKK